mmetsp:Transcript_61566/g.194106  ORF Transcript_61566/g.194106 Transcript_61566/m.194106 type:complete len:307 (-) Transcript_61566:52-972(-)
MRYGDAVKSRTQAQSCHHGADFSRREAKVGFEEEREELYRRAAAEHRDDLRALCQHWHQEPLAPPKALLLFPAQRLRACRACAPSGHQLCRSSGQAREVSGSHSPQAQVGEADRKLPGQPQEQDVLQPRPPPGIRPKERDESSLQTSRHCLAKEGGRLKPADGKRALLALRGAVGCKGRGRAFVGLGMYSPDDNDRHQHGLRVASQSHTATHRKDHAHDAVQPQHRALGHAVGQGAEREGQAQPHAAAKALQDANEGVAAVAEVEEVGVEEGPQRKGAHGRYEELGADQQAHVPRGRLPTTTWGLR